MSGLSAAVEAPFLDPHAFATAFERWVSDHPEVLEEVRRPIPVYADRVAAMRRLMGALFAEGWSRHGWPEPVGGVGGTILHRAAMWEVLARHGVPGMTVFEHLEVLLPTLAEFGPREFTADAIPEFLSGRESWAQGFSEPGAGSDLAALRTTASPTEGGFLINGRKIWTSWAKYGTWCLLLARTGTTESRHRGLTAFIVALDSPGVEVSPIVQANGTDELAEVAFDDVFVPADRIVGQLDGGWAIAMHILSHERGTYAWFRHLFLYQLVRDAAAENDERNDVALGNAVLDLAVASSLGLGGVHAHAAAKPLGPRATFNKLSLCSAEQSVSDWMLAGDPDLVAGVQSDEVLMRRQEYLFSRIVTVYGGSQQMQLETIAKQILRLP